MANQKNTMTKATDTQVLVYSKENKQLQVQFNDKGAFEALAQQQKMVLAINKDDAEQLKEASKGAASDVYTKPIAGPGKKTLLHIAAEHGSLDVLKLLISNYNDVDIRSGNDLTPLHCALLWGNDAAVEFLKENGADTSAAVQNKTAQQLEKLIDNLGRENVVRETDEKKLRSNVTFLNKLHVKPTLIAAARHRLGAIDAKSNKKAYDKQEWTRKQSVRVSQYNAEMKAAMKQQAREQAIEKKRKTTHKQMAAPKNYEKSKLQAKLKSQKFKQLQEISKKRSEEILKKRSESSEDQKEDPMKWLIENDGILKSNVKRN